MRSPFRRISVVLLCLSTVLAVPSAVAAAAPSNDLFENATTITSLPYSEAIDLTEATDDPEFPPCEAGVRRRIWYRITPAADEAIRVSVGGDQTAELALWKVTGAAPSGVELTGCAVDGHDLVRRVVAGQEYAISVGQWVPADPMIATLTVAVQPPPANDYFADALPIESSPFSAIVTEGEAAAATTEPSEPRPSCLVDESVHNTVWYRFEALDGAHATVSHSGIATVAVHRGASLDSLTEVVCINGGSATFDAVPGDTYYVQLIASTFRDSDVNLEWIGPPANDDFAASIEVSDSSSQLIADLTVATVESGEPAPSCASGRVQTAWWSFTAPDDGTLTANLDFGGFWAAYEGSSLAGLTELACAASGGPVPIHVTSGQAVHLQLGFVAPQQGTASLQLQFEATPDNDNFEDAIRVSVGDVVALDLSGATIQQGEPNPPTCGFWPGSSVWYEFVGTGESASFSLDPGSQSWAIAAYTGSTVDGLTSLGCRMFEGPPLTIRPATGEVVHLQVWAYDFCCSATSTLRVTVPGNPTPAFTTSIADPSSFDDVTFIDQTIDPGGNPVVAWSWSFGDGSTTTDQFPVHRFTTDGDHHVALTVTTSDGRTGSATQTVSVRTHDVGIARFLVPASAKAGQTKQVTVGIGNRRYPETVTIQLQVSQPGGSWQDVGTVGRDIPVLGRNQTVDVKFDYRFTQADATAGKVTFRAIVTLTSGRDALPSDNEAISLATRVLK